MNQPVGPRAQPLSGQHKHLSQSIPRLRWTPVVIQGKTLIWPPDTERGINGCHLFGLVGHRRPANMDIKLNRHPRGKPADQTGLDSIVVPQNGPGTRRRFRWNKVYHWTGLIAVETPFTVELWHDGLDPITVVNAIFKMDWLASEGEATW